MARLLFFCGCVLSAYEHQTEWINSSVQGIDVCIYNFHRLLKERAYLARDKRQKFAKKQLQKKTFKQYYTKAKVMFSTIKSSVLSRYPALFLKLITKSSFECLETPRKCKLPGTLRQNHFLGVEHFEIFLIFF